MLKLRWNIVTGQVSVLRHHALVPFQATREATLAAQIYLIDPGQSSPIQIPAPGEVRFTVRTALGATVTFLAVLTVEQWDATHDCYDLSLPISGEALDTLLSIGTPPEGLSVPLLAALSSRPDATQDSDWAESKIFLFTVSNNLTRAADS